MSKKKILLAVSITLIILAAAFVAFWFYKANSLKKAILSKVAQVNGSVSIQNIIISGFPFKQIVTLDDINFYFSPDKNKSSPYLGGSSFATNKTMGIQSSAVADGYSNLAAMALNSNNNYQIQVKKIEYSTSIFANDVTIKIIGDIAIKDTKGATYLLKFNQSPSVNIIFAKNYISKYSYLDQGCKILDASNNQVLFESASLSYLHDFKRDGDKYSGKLNIQMQGVSFIIPEDFPKSQILAQTPAQIPATLPNTINQNNGVTVLALPPAQAPTLVKRDFVLDLEYSMVLPEQLPGADSVKNATKPQVTPNLKKANQKPIVTNIILSIKNLEVVDPSYQINVNGDVHQNPKDSSFIFDVSLRFEKFDNLAAYLKKSWEESLPKSKSANAPVDDVVKNDPTSAVIKVIKDLAAKNLATNSKTTVLHFKKEEAKSLMINDVDFNIVLGQIFTSMAPQTAHQKNNNSN